MRLNTSKSGYMLLYPRLTISKIIKKISLLLPKRDTRQHPYI